MYPDMPSHLADGDRSDEDGDKNKKDLEGGKRGKSSGNAFDDLDSIVVSESNFSIVMYSTWLPYCIVCVDFVK